MVSSNGIPSVNQKEIFKNLISHENGYRHVSKLKICKGCGHIIDDGEEACLS